MTDTYEYPPKYEKVSEWLRFDKTLKTVSISQIETKFNIRYNQSRLIVHALIRAGVIESTSDNQGQYTIFR